MIFRILSIYVKFQLHLNLDVSAHDPRRISSAWLAHLLTTQLLIVQQTFT